MRENERIQLNQGKLKTKEMMIEGRTWKTNKVK